MTLPSPSFYEATTGPVYFVGCALQEVTAALMEMAAVTPEGNNSTSVTCHVH